MQIKNCFLDSQNTFPCGSMSLGELVRRSGKEYLWEERSGVTTDTVVMHYISAADSSPDEPFCLASILKIYCDCGVSCHYMVERTGAVLNLVPEPMKAWHCGPSIMPEQDNRTGVNDFSIGIELVATADSGFTDAQYRSADELARALKKRFGPAIAFVGHSDIAGERAVALGLRELPKSDPGPLFDWARFRHNLDEPSSGSDPTW